MADEIITNPPPPSNDNKESTALKKSAEVVKSFSSTVKNKLDGSKTRDPVTSQEFLTKNLMRLIEKTYWFIAFILGLFCVVAIFKESIVQLILPLFTLILGSIFTLIGTNILGAKNNQQQQS